METIYGDSPDGKRLPLHWGVAVTGFVIPSPTPSSPPPPGNEGTSSATPSGPNSGELQDCTHP